MGDPRISDFMALLEVAKTNSFSSAARNLKTSPVNLFNRINKLESYFQVEIFTRTNRGVFLTRDGERIVEVSKAIVGLLSAPQPPSEQSGKVTPIKLGASHIPGQYVLPCLISNYQLSNPSIRFDLSITDTEPLLKQLEEGGLDLACFSGLMETRSAKTIEIAKDRLVPVASPKYDIARKVTTLREVLRQPLILYEDGHETARLVEDFLEHYEIKSNSLDVRMKLPEPEGVITAVSEGLGLGICPEIIAKKSERAGLINIVQTKDGRDWQYPIIAKLSDKNSEETKGFWSYLSNVSKRFDGNLPCVLKMLYL